MQILPLKHFFGHPKRIKKNQKESNFGIQVCCWFFGETFFEFKVSEKLGIQDFKEKKRFQRKGSVSTELFLEKLIQVEFKFSENFNF